MPLETKTLDELEAIGRGAIRALIPDADVSPLSDYDVTARMAAAVAMGQQQQAEYVALQIFPESADEDSLQLHAKRYGLSRLPAAKSLGKVVVPAVTSGVLIDTGSVFAHGDGTQFLSTAPTTTDTPGWSGKTVGTDSTVYRLVVHPSEAGMYAGQLLSVDGEVRAIKEVISGASCVDLYDPLPLAPTAGTTITPETGAVVSVEAVEAGAEGNKPIGDTLTMTAPPTGVGPGARVCELGGGGDEESVEELRARIMAWEATPPACGNAEHVRQLARATPGVRLEDAVVFPGFRGLGTVDVFPIGISGARFVSSGALALVEAQLAAELPEALDVSVQALTPGASTDIDVTITAERGYERDFVGGPYAIGTGSTTTRIVVTTAPTAVEVGDRVQVQLFLAGRWSVFHMTVAGTKTTSPYHIDLEEPLPIAPVDTDPDVLSGGPLVEPVRDAVLGIFDRLGPSARSGSSWVFERHPLPTEAWSDTLTRAALIEALMAVPGVGNVVVTTPSSDITPTAQQVAVLSQLFLRFTEVT